MLRGAATPHLSAKASTIVEPERGRDVAGTSRNVGKTEPGRRKNEPMPTEVEPVTTPVRYLASGDTALVIEFGDRVDQRLSGLVVALGHRIAEAAIPGVVEMVPTFRSLMVHYDPVVLPQAELKRRLAPMLDGLEATGGSGRRWRIPACYDESLGVDLPEVAGRMGISPAQVIERHSAATFHVYMMGFLPGLPYLGGLPSEFALPRRENPRIKVPKGAVAVAMSMTVIYPLESPGGWHILARTPVPLWDMGADPPALLDAGDKVMFEPIPLARYEAMLEEAAAGRLRLFPEGSPESGGRRA
jgi:KipI family sensor histidine kinase inhibitor